MPPTTPADELTLRALRRAAKLTLRELSALTGYDIAYLSRIERGLKSAPDSTLTIIRHHIGRHLARSNVA